MFANALLRRSVLTKPNASMQRLANFNQMNTMAVMPMRSFALRSAPALSDESDDLSVRPRVKLDEFFFEYLLDKDGHFLSSVPVKDPE